MRRFLLVALCALAFAPVAEADVLLGVKGDANRLKAQTGQRSDGRLIFLSWGQGQTWGKLFHKWLPDLGDVPIVSISSMSKPPKREAITPLGIAQGKGDSYLRALGRAVHEHGGPVIVRPLAEMNGHWNAWCAYNSNGTRRNEAHSTRNFKRAFKRIYLILHGGDKATIDAKLAASGMPPVAADLPENPYPTLTVLWNPQGFGSPNLPGNSAHSYYPGNAYVDMVGNDMYDIRYRATWEANLALYRRYPSKPYAMGEFGLWGIDDPAFIQKMAKFIRRNSRVKLAIFYESRAGSVFDLATKPKSRAAYRKYIAPLNR